MEIFDITDYGAVLDDSTDCGPAIAAARADAIAQSGGIIYHPGGGIAKVSTGIDLPDVNSDFQGFYGFCGAKGGGSIYRLDEIAQKALFSINNASQVHVSDITVLGGPNYDNTAGLNAQAIIQITTAWQATFDNVWMVGCTSSGPGGLIYVNNAHLTMRDCFFGGSVVTGANTAFINIIGCPSVVLQRIQCPDYHRWNDEIFNRTSTLVVNPRAHIRIDNGSRARTITNPTWKIEDSFFDESVSFAQIELIGNDEDMFQCVELNNVFVNSNSGKPNIIASDLKKITIKDYIAAWSGTPRTIACTNTTEVNLDTVIFSAGNDTVQLNEGVEVVRMRNCEGVELELNDTEPIVQVG